MGSHRQMEVEGAAEEGLLPSVPPQGHPLRDRLQNLWLPLVPYYPPIESIQTTHVPLV